jgi:hypothetical protein
MSRIGDRLRKLEDAEPERCENCRDWPCPFLVFEESDKDPLEGVPERCPKCGYEPFVVIVRFTERAGRL